MLTDHQLLWPHGCRGHAEQLPCRRPWRRKEVSLLSRTRTRTPGRAAVTWTESVVPRSEDAPGRPSRRRPASARRIETAVVHVRRPPHTVEIVNLSRGGAMIRCGLQAAPVGHDRASSSARDMRSKVPSAGSGDGCIGLEFAHETKIECSPERARRGPSRGHSAQLPGQQSACSGRSCCSSRTSERMKTYEDARDEKRHPLIWTGEIHSRTAANPVRLRNVSAGGALVDVDGRLSARRGSDARPGRSGQVFRHRPMELRRQGRLALP